MEWVRAVVATTLGVAPRGDLPPILMQQEVPSIWDQIRESSMIPTGSYIMQGITMECRQNG